MFPVVKIPTKLLMQMVNKWCLIQIRMKLDNIIASLKDLHCKPCTENRSIKKL